MALNLDDALRILSAACDHATNMGTPENVAVVDSAGHLIAQHRMDGAIWGSVAIALDKAWSAAAFRVPTAVLAELCQPGAVYHGLQDTNAGRIVMLPGGVPILRDGTVVGAIGVSGAEPDEDLAVAEAGIAAL